MKTEEEKPNARNAWSFTVSAVGFQMCSVCYAAMSEVRLTVFLLFATAGVVASLCAVREWKKYFEAFTRHEIRSRSKG
ncbi:hypothetical protein OAE61_04020 [Verrucomicrobiales bacterium]|nr:hypothetical protein [Verrucomicrobiales bacterium]MDA7922631.1 hypothetical protein [Verrucomicrobiales bacterium]MDB4662780.1 hypothetical protein [Verrucomicrobiales bacterium]MDC0276753.1 hypothetical protein [Verrucomicrobiales bacterium]MDC0291725.1 hypothetical protein [Verrucomicrobiales bacterium]